MISESFNGNPLIIKETFKKIEIWEMKFSSRYSELYKEKKYSKRSILDASVPSSIDTS